MKKSQIHTKKHIQISKKSLLKKLQNEKKKEHRAYRNEKQRTEGIEVRKWKQKNTRHQKMKKRNKKHKASKKRKRKIEKRKYLKKISESHQKHESIKKGLALWEGLNLFITSYVSTCKSPHFIAYCCQCIPLPTAAERTCMFPSELTCPLLLDSLYLLCKSMMNVRLSSASQWPPGYGRSSLPFQGST